MDLIEKYNDSELIVLENEGREGVKYFVDLASGFSIRGLSETYDNSGRPVEFQHCDEICPRDEEGDPVAECGCLETTVRAKNYHDGSKMRTIIILADEDEFECDYSEVEDEDRSAILAALRDAEFAGEERGGIQEYKGGNYVISQSQWQGDWALYTLTEKE